MQEWYAEHYGSFGYLHPIKPALVGRQKMEVIMGKGTGAASVNMKLKEWQMEASREQVNRIVDRVKKEAIIRKWSINDETLRGLIDEVLNPKK